MIGRAANCTQIPTNEKMQFVVHPYGNSAVGIKFFFSILRFQLVIYQSSSILIYFAIFAHALF